VAGHAWEWCSTKDAPYPYNPNDGREIPPVSYSECCRVLRGGSWQDIGDNIRCANRNYGYPNRRDDDGIIGFRCVRTR